MTVKQAGYSKEAFSLIEIMVAVGIMVIGLTAILASYANMFILGDLARDLSRATNAARARMEEVKQVEFDSLDALNATTFDLEGFNHI
ncbi:MAG: type II secretion system GspH family protein, partial [Candidatus Omnitrophica bacterium]|nr:type II secretion system GspH family protein [Candidatus Omnitrophota bacterium]